MFIKRKRQGRKTYFELAHSQRQGKKVKQYSVYLGPTLALSGEEWIRVLASAKGFRPTIRKVFPLVEVFIREYGLPRDTIRGLQDAARLDWQQKKPLSAYRLLGLQTGATPEQVKAAFRRLSLIHHPDHGGDPVEFQKLVRARDALSTPTSASNVPLRGRK